MDDYSQLWRVAALDENRVERRPTTAGHFGGETFDLVRNLFLAAEGAAPRMVVMCAAEAGGASDWICAQTAELLASQGVGSVCLVDGNLERPSLHEYFECGNRVGLGNALASPGPAEDFVCTVGSGRLWLLTAGQAPDRYAGAEAEVRARLQARIAELRKGFDYVLVHAPPAGSGPLCMWFSAMATGTVLILEPSITRQQAARSAKARIEAAGGRVLGVVLHRAR